MSDHSRVVSGRVHEAASTTWDNWRQKLANIKPKVQEDESTKSSGPRSVVKNNLTHEEEMIAKIRLRMKELPHWYETEQDKVAKMVSIELDRIGLALEHDLPDAVEPVEVWNVPLSVFNWLADNEHGFVHGSLQAWSSAQKFNESNAANLDRERKTELRESFYSIAPPLLQEVLVQLLSDNSLRVSFGRKFVGPELKFLVLKVDLLV